MALLSNSKSVFINDGTLTFSGGDYTFDFTENKNFIQVELEDGQTTNLKFSQFLSIDKIVIGQDTNVTIDFARLETIEDIDFQANGGINLTGITFTTADVAGDAKFDPGQNLDAIVSELIQERGVTGAINALTINGNKGDAFKVIWDHLDDNYSYYNTNVNDAFIDLGIAYAKYLKEGGTPLTDVIVKFQADGSDADAAPERSQSLHDNILGNLDELSIVDKFGAGSGAIIDRIQNADLEGFIGEEGVYTDGRPIYGGYDTQDQMATRAFDADYFLI